MNVLSSKLILYCLAMCIVCILHSCSSSNKEVHIIREKPRKISTWKKVACTVRLRSEGCYDYLEGKLK